MVNLQTLKLEHCKKLRELPNTIGTLMHLNYLDLSLTDIEVLPSSITKLVSLKHLDLGFCGNLTHMPHGLGQLTSLQTVNLFVLSEDLVGSSKHCGGLAELKK